MAGTEEFRRTDSGGVLTVTFTRDDKLNAVTPGMLDALRTAADELAEREDARVLVIAAEGRHFTAGMDITTLAAQGGGEGGALRRNYRRLHLLFDELEAIEKPVVLAAQGPCRGFGVELAASCDFRICSDRAVFGLPEIANLAVLPGSGGISRLTRLVGPHWTKWIAMAGQEVDAAQALSIGLVHAVHADADFPAAVDAFARSLVALSGEALGLAKLGIAAAASADRGSARDFDRMANTLLLKTPEHLARIEAFGSRKPKR
ncbi:MAG: putative acyl-CoA hydratase [Frankiales bacterium]|nr:putative acyl-CoA hydratase [Frankiales bacterium]